MTPRLTIIIVTYNSVPVLDACLRSLTRHLPAVSHEILVVDNASTDGTAAVVRHGWPAIRLLDNAANVGFARANNAGIRASISELVLLLNPDTRVTAGAIDALVAALDATPDAAIVGPRLVDDRGRAELSFGSMIGPLQEMRQKLLVQGNERGTPFISGYVERLTRRARDVDWVSGACLLVRRVDAEAVGLLDERYFMYTEDVDFCAAVRRRGRRVLFSPSAEVAHARGSSALHAAVPTQAAYRASQLAFYEKHHPRWAGLLRLYLKVKGQLPEQIRGS